MDNLLRDIEAFIRVRDMSPTDFGKEAMNDTAFVHALRRGRDVKLSTIRKVRQFMETYD